MQDEFDFNRGAIRPIQCLSDGYDLLKGRYGSFLGVFIIGGLIIMIGALIPLSPLLPPIVCGMYMCMFAIIRREPVNTNTLFQGFNHFGQSFIASLVYSIPIFILSFVMQFGVFGFSAVVENLELEKNPPAEVVLPALYGFFVFIFGMVLLIFAVSMILGILMAFVYPLIVDRKLIGVQALKLSVRAVFGNFFGVVGLTLLGYLILLAGWMFFYVGALFVAPYIFAAWAVAYRRVFSQRVSNANQQTNAPQHSAIPPISTSKAGWVLTFGAVLIVGIWTTSFAAIGYYIYQAIDKNSNKNRIERTIDEKDMPTVTYPSTTPNVETTPSNRKDKLKTISSGVLNGKATSLPKPDYPASAKAVNARGSVNVSIKVDETGKVIFARAVSGHPLLRAAAEKAALEAEFPPQSVGGKPVKVSGVLVYNFDGK